MTLVSELAESPAVVDRLVRSARGPLTELAGRVEQRGIDAVFLAARGTSDHAATYAQYVLGIRNGWRRGWPCHRSNPSTVLTRTSAGRW